MFKCASRFKMGFSTVVIIFSSFALMGCPKKVSPVVGSEGISSQEQSSASSSTPSSKGGSVERTKPDSRSGEPTERELGGSDEQASIRNNQSEKGGTERRDSFDGSVTPSPEDEMASSRGTQSPDKESGMAMSEPTPTFSSNVYFDFDMWKIRNDAKHALTENARWLVSNSGIEIQIEGHGDERGTNEYNLALGERRARSTKRYLVNLGVAPSRISFISYGEEKSICNDKNEHCFQKNRRAHFVVNR